MFQGLILVPAGYSSFGERLRSISFDNIYTSFQQMFKNKKMYKNLNTGCPKRLDSKEISLTIIFLLPQIKYSFVERRKS